MRDETRVEQLIRKVIEDRDFEIRLASWGAEVAVTVLDENDPRKGCAQLRGESHAGFMGSISDALIDACEQALRDEYPQATACGRCVKQRESGRGWTTCVLDKVHEGPCKDEHGNTET